MNLTQFALSNNNMRANILIMDEYSFLDYPWACRLGNYTGCNDDIAVILVEFKGYHLNSIIKLAIVVPSNWHEITKEDFIKYVSNHIYITNINMDTLYDLFVACATLIDTQMVGSLSDLDEIEDKVEQKVLDKLIWIVTTETDAEKEVFRNFCMVNGIDAPMNDSYAALFRCTDGDIAVFTFSNDKTIDELKAELNCSDELFEKFKDMLKRLFERQEARAKTVAEMKKAIEEYKKFFSRENMKAVEDKATDKAADLLTFILSLRDL